jgi:hypothetical protein
MSACARSRERARRRTGQLPLLVVAGDEQTVETALRLRPDARALRLPATIDRVVDAIRTALGVGAREPARAAA